MKNLLEVTVPSDRMICDLFMNQVALSAVVVADELDIFRMLEAQSLDALTIANNLQTLPRSSEVLLNALAAEGFLNLRDGKYCLNEFSNAFLKRGSPVCRIYQFYSNKDTWAYKRISGMMKMGPDPVALKDQSYSSMWEQGNLTKEAANRFTAMMNTNIGAVAIAMVQSGLFDEFESVVDVGGGSGIFLAAIRQRSPKKDLTLFELPFVIEAAKEILAAYIDPSSINYRAGSFFEPQTELHGQCYFLSNILHDWKREKGLQILKHLRNSSRKGDSIIVSECLLNPDRLSPKHTVMYDLMMHLNHDSQQFTESEITTLLLEAGFKNVRRVYDFGYYSAIRADACR